MAENTRVFRIRPKAIGEFENNIISSLVQSSRASVINNR